MAGANPSWLTAGDRRYVSAAMKAPMLERDEERKLARRWRDRRDEKALARIVNSHVRLSVRFASRFKAYGLPVGDLIQEGNTGLLAAANRFDPDRGVRFSTYAAWWILAAMQEFVVRNSSVVRLSTTPAQKGLFFKLRRLRARLAGSGAGRMTGAERDMIADELGVPVAAVERMESRLSAPDLSLNAPMGEGDSVERQDLLADDRATPDAEVEDLVDGETRSRWLREAMEHLTPREREVISRRFLGDGGKITLAEIGDDFGVTKERVRQIEGKALSKLRAALDGHDREDLLAN